VEQLLEELTSGWRHMLWEVELLLLNVLVQLLVVLSSEGEFAAQKSEQ